MKKSAIYVSVWDDGIQIRTKCIFDTSTRDVTDIEPADADGLEILEDEFIELPDGTTISRELFTIDGDE